MSTKIVAARLATSAGVTTIITRASSPGNIAKIVHHVQACRTPHPDECVEDALSKSISSLQVDVSESQVPLHTRFLPSPQPIRDRSFWILHGLKPHGTLYIDAGAHKALVGRAGL